MGLISILQLLDTGRIDPIILCMGSDKPDINQAMSVNNHDNHKGLIALDIENDPVIRNKAGIAVKRFDIRRAIPSGAFHIMKPGLQGNGSIRVFLPEFPQDTPADDPHKKDYITKLPKW
jgi:hypothetical protein